MKILLVEPPISPYDIPTGLAALPEPLSLEILAATVPDHEVRILDMRIDDSLDKEINTFQPDLVGTAGVTANLHLAKNVLKHVKEIGPAITTVIGGHHASLIPRDCFDSAIDIVAIGEGERTFPELVHAIENRRSLESIPGIAFKDNSRYITNQERPLIDINTMPVAVRSLTRRYRKQYFRGTWRPTASVIFSRGCPFRCEFCAEWKINKGKYRVRNPHSVMREISGIEEKFVHFIDDNTLEDYKSSRDLAQLIKAEGIKKTYEVYGRSDTIVQHPDLIDLWRDIGLKLVLIGFESISEKRLRTWNKKVTVKNNDEAINILHDHGIEIAAYFVIDPSFEAKDFEELTAYIEKKRLTHPIFTILSPFPGTELRNKREGELLTKSYEILDFFHTVFPTALPLESFYQQFANLYMRAYSSQKALKRIFKSSALLSPRLLIRNQRLKKKLRELSIHHKKAVFTGISRQ